MKCDKFDCSKDAIKTVADHLLEIKINVCKDHYDELAKMNRWDIKK